MRFNARTPPRSIRRQEGDPIHTAFVLGLFDTGLAAVRSLGREGITVIGVDSDARMPGSTSRYCSPRIWPDPVHRPEELLDVMMETGQRLEESGVLIPSSDAYVLFVARYQGCLSPSYRFSLPPADVVEAIVNKRRQYELAEKVGIPIPRTMYPETVEELESIKNELDYPVFLKPCYGHLWREKFGGAHKGFKVTTPEELIARFSDILPYGFQVMVQSVVPGPNLNHYKVCACLDQKGSPLALFTLRKIRQYPTEFGVGTLVESVHNPELMELGMRFLRGIGYRGIGSIEFKRDARDGRFKLIELNPRLWLQNDLASACGMNFPLLSYLDLTGQHPGPVRDFPAGVKWLDAVNDFRSFWHYFRAGRLSAREWIRSWSGTGSFATYARDDMRPFLTANRYGVRYLRLPFYMLKSWTNGQH